MTLRLKQTGKVAMLALLSSVLPNLASAQGLTFDFQLNANATPQRYGLLNGDLLSLYINARGDLGAPFTGLNKPAGSVNANGQALVNADGSVQLQNPPFGPAIGGTYAALFTRNSTAGAASVGASVQAKNEYVSLSGRVGGMTEGYSVVGQNPGLNDGFGGWLQAGNLVLNSFDVTGGSVLGPLGATSILSTQRGGLQIQQNVAFQTDANSKNQVKFTVQMTNNSNSTMDGVRYARTIDPNPGASSTPATNQTRQKFRTDTRPEAFALDSFVLSDRDRHLALGVLPTDPGTQGTILLATSTLAEGDLLLDPLAQLDGNPYVQLLAGNGAEFVDAAGNSTVVSDYVTATGFDDFFGSAASNSALLLISPEYTIAPGTTQTFVFYYFFDPITSAGGDVPEPGVLALGLGATLGGGLLALRRRRSR